MHLGQIAAQTPDKPAVIMAGSGRTVTYRELNEESNRLAQLLHAEGLRPGDHIAFMLENHPLYLAIAWAAQRSGLYYTAVSSRLGPDEVAYIVANCEARVFIADASIPAIAQNPPDVPLRLMLGGTAPATSPTRSASPRSPPRPSRTSARAWTCSTPRGPRAVPRA